MARRPAVTMTGTFALLALGGMLFAPTRPTLALWSESQDVGALSATIDSYTITPADASLRDESPIPTKAIWNTSAVKITNPSSTLTRSVKLESVHIANRYSVSEPKFNLATSSAVTYQLPPEGKTCASTYDRRPSPRWRVKNAGVAVSVAEYPAPESFVVDVAPNSTQEICIDYAVDRSSSTTEDRRTMLLNLAGQGVKTTTKVRTTDRLSTDGTESGTVDSHYRIALPQPVADAGINGGAPGCEWESGGILSGYLGLFWDWVTAQPEGVAGSTPAIDHWELWSSEDGSPYRRHHTGIRLMSGGSDLPDGKIPAHSRAVRVERAQIRSTGVVDFSRHYRKFLLVGVLRGGEHIVAPTAWNLSWNGVATAHTHRCEPSVDTPEKAIGVPNMPGPRW